MYLKAVKSVLTEPDWQINPEPINLDLKMYSKLPSPVRVKLYNTLPIELKILQTLTRSQVKFKPNRVLNTFYSAEEFINYSSSKNY